MSRLRRLLPLTLALVLALAGSAFAQQPLVPPETLAQAPPPETLQQPETLPGDEDEDDEELGEEIPEPEPEPEPEPAPVRPDPPPDPPARVRRPLPRTGENPLPFLAFAAILISGGMSLRTAVNRT